jgi:hypothetical protein
MTNPTDFPVAPARCPHCPFRQRAADDREEYYAPTDAAEWTRGIDAGCSEHRCHERPNQRCAGAAEVPQGFEAAATRALAARFSADRLMNDFPGEGGGGHHPELEEEGGTA